MLPTFKDLNGKVGLAIRPEKQQVSISNTPAQTGAAKRRSDGPMGEELRKLRIFGDRQPLPAVTEDVKAVKGGDVGPRTKNRDEPVRAAPVYTMPAKRREETQDQPVRQQPRNDPPQKHREEPKQEPAKQPRNDPPPRSEPSKSDVKADKPADKKGKGGRK